MITTDKYILFWSGPFGNFHRCLISYDDHSFWSSEQLFMYLKAKTFEDWESARKIKVCDEPKEAKVLGRKIKGFDESIWRKRREECMTMALYEKFSQDFLLCDKLLDNKYAHLQFVEASPYDSIWGIGLEESNPDAADSSKWQGENLLGKCLDRVRERLLAEGKRQRERIKIERLYFVDEDNTSYYELIAKHHNGKIRIKATINYSYYSRGENIHIDIRYKIIKRNFDENGERFYTEHKSLYSTNILANGSTTFSFDFDQECLNCHRAMLCLSVEFEGEGETHRQQDFLVCELPKDYRELLNITEVRIFRNKVFSDDVYLKEIDINKGAEIDIAVDGTSTEEKIFELTLNILDSDRNVVYSGARGFIAFGDRIRRMNSNLYQADRDRTTLQECKKGIYTIQFLYLNTILLEREFKIGDKDIKGRFSIKLC